MNPYQVLGLQTGSDIMSVKKAYKFLASKYDLSKYEEGTPEYENARIKMDEINRAYDEIVTNVDDSSYHSGNNSYQHSSFSDIRQMINSNRLDDAQMLLEGVALSSRNAEWYYLKGLLMKKKGWHEQAYDNFEKAYNMNPGNVEYQNAYESMSGNNAGGYRTSRRGSNPDKSGCMGDCSVCDICSSLLCADCCCECMGGDLISCC